MLIAPTEPLLLRSLGQTNVLPESYGVDFLIVLGRHGLAGVQRKEWKDLLASVADGRLAKEVAQMGRLSIAMLLVEGRPPWAIDGRLHDQYRSHWTKDSFAHLLLSVQQQGVLVRTTDNIEESVRALQAFEVWAKKDKHTSLVAAPRPPKSAWGTRDSRDWNVWLAQALVEKMGPGKAAKLVDHFGGRLPLRWTVGEKELRAVDGIGPKLAAALMEVFGTDP